MKKIIIGMIAISVIAIFSIVKFKSHEIHEGETHEKVDAAGIESTLNLSENGFLEPIKSITSGQRHALVLTEDNILYSFGVNAEGQLGIGTTDNSDIPVKVADSADGTFINDGRVKKVTAFGTHTLILTTDGVVYSFGDNDYGQLGIGTSGTGLFESKPVKLGNSADGTFINDGRVKDITTGNAHSLILTTDGVVYSFGWNRNGQLGIGSSSTSTSKNLPVKINNSADSTFINDGRVKEIEAGQFHSGIVTNDGVAYTFGYNYYGQLGNGSTASTENTPVKMVSSEDGTFVNDGRVKELSFGRLQTVILTTSGSLFTVGYNAQGQLGDGTFQNKNKPVKVVDNGDFTNSNIASVSTEDYHVLVLKNDGIVYAFGYNYYGQLGIGTTRDTSKAVKVLNSADGRFINDGRVIDVSAGASTSIILTNEKKAYTVGEAEVLGNSSNTMPSQSTKFVWMRGDLAYASLSGKALEHDKSKVTKFSGDVTISNVSGTLSLKKGTGTYVDITSKYEGLYNGGSYKFIVGDSGDGTWHVGIDQETEFTLEILSGTTIVEYTFIIDKKPPKITEVIAEGSNSACNIINESEYYCNQNVSFTTYSDLSGYYVAKKEIEGTDGATDIITDIPGVLSHTLESSNLEKAKVTYTLIDGAGNTVIISVVMDNYIPRVEQK